MRTYIVEFLRRGLTACGIGPVVLAVIYHILHHTAALETLSVRQVCVGILSITALAFIAGGMNVLYQIERLPLMAAILIHGAVLYVGYLATYLLNDWLEWGIVPIIVFSGIFAVGYLIIWAILYAVVRRRTATINEQLKKKQNMP